MTGSDESSWSWLHNVLVPALLAALEAAWVSAWLSAVVHVTPHGRTVLPFAALAVPGALAAALAGATQRLPRSPWVRIALQVGAVVAGAVVTAGAIGALWLHGSFAAIAMHPWTAKAGPAASAVQLAWFAAVLAWVRGTWLGWEEPSISHIIVAVAVATLAYGIFFIAAATHTHDASLHDEVVPAVVRVLLSFPLGMAVIALVAERDLELRTLSRPMRPSLAWLAAIAIPMAGIAIVALVVALAVGPLIPLVGDFIKAVVLLLLDIVGAIAQLIAGLLPAHRAPMPRPLKIPGHPSTLGLPPRPHRLVWEWVTAIVIASVGAGAALFVLVAVLRRLRPRLQMRRREPVTRGDEERTSVFTWAHLLAQILGVLRRIGGRLRPAPRGRSASTPATADGAARHRADSIRGHYLEVLAAARGVGRGRRAHETPAELQRRLAPVTGEPAGAELLALTGLYERVRYGGQDGGEEQVRAAGGQAEAVVTALLQTPLQ